MELCTNGALREALKLSISWPLKVIDYYSSMKQPWVSVFIKRLVVVERVWLIQ